MSKLDRLVAESVLDWYVDKERSPYRWRVPLDSTMFRDWESALVTACPPFSTSIAAVWEVVEHLQRGGFRLRLMDQHDSIGMWDCRFYKYPESTLIDYKTSKTAPEAICLAALRAVGVDEQTIQEAMR